MNRNEMNRRDALRVGAVTGMAMATGSVALSASPRHPVSTPDQALDRLLEGNRRFARGAVDAPRRGLDRVAALSTGQSPYAAILGCADSRVPPEILVDEGFGDLFTVRVAGNVATPEEIASLEYAVGVLGSQVVLVLGHTSCGAVTAALEGDAVPGQISSLFQHITPAIPDGADIAAAVEANARQQAHVLRSSSPVVRDAIAAGQVAVRAAVYSLHDGRVRLLD